MIISAFGAVLILLDLFGTPARVAGLVAVVAGAIVAAPYAERRGAAVTGWWTMLAVGTALAIAGTAVSIGIDSLGGLLAVVGGALVATGSVLGYPARDR